MLGTVCVPAMSMYNVCISQNPSKMHIQYGLVIIKLESAKSLRGGTVAILFLFGNNCPNID
jgi:hypothetical protein